VWQPASDRYIFLPQRLPAAGVEKPPVSLETWLIVPIRGKEGNPFRHGSQIPRNLWHCFGLYTCGTASYAVKYAHRIFHRNNRIQSIIYMAAEYSHPCCSN